MECHSDVLRFWEMFADGAGEGKSLIQILCKIKQALLSEPMGNAAAVLAADLEYGETLSQAMANQPAIFTKAHICLVEGGERVGRIGRLLRLICELTRDCPACGSLRFPEAKP
jgi:type II secretory pathway component PulF